MTRCAALFLACALDALLGDPYSMPHIIRLIGSLIAATERLLRHAFPQTPRGERLAGIALVAAVLSVSCGSLRTLALVWRRSSATRCSPPASWASRRVRSTVR